MHCLLPLWRDSGFPRGTLRLPWLYLDSVGQETFVLPSVEASMFPDIVQEFAALNRRQFLW